MACLRMFSTVLVVLCAVSPSIVVGWSDFIRQNVCENLHVSHGQDTIDPTENVTLSLMKNGIPVPRQCFELGTMYTIELRSTGRPFKGLLMRTESSSPGIFPKGDLPNNIVRNVCSRRGWSSISHRFPPTHGGTNILGSVLHFGYMSPSAPTKDPFFLRYTVVFTYLEFYENQAISFPPCSELASTEPLTTVTTENSTTEKPTMTKPSCVNNSRPAPQDNLTSNPGSDDSQVCTDFKENDGAKTVNGNCGRLSNGSMDRRTYTHTNGITYDCQIDTTKSSLVRKTYCTPTCISGDGQQLCCKIGQIRDRKRWYTCSPYAGEQYTQTQGTNRSISVQLWARVEKTCICYKCSDVTCTGDTSCEESENSTKEPNDNSSL